MPQTTFTFEFSGAVTLSVDEIWPDGDAPENPTLQDVLKQINETGNFGSSVSILLNDWGLEEHLLITIRDRTGKSTEV